MAAPAGSSPCRPSKGGEVRQGRGAWRAPAARYRSDRTRRRDGYRKPGAPTTVRKPEKIASPGCSAGRRMPGAAGPAPVPGSSALAPLGEPARLPGQERPRHQPRAAVRAGCQFQAAAFGDRVSRDPGADAVPVHVAVRLVLVPRGALGGPGLLHQDVIVAGAQLRGSRQRGGHRGYPRVPGQLPDLRYLPPPAEVLYEGARVTGAAGDLGQRAARGQDDVNRGSRDRGLLRAQHLPDAHDAIPGKRRS